MVGAPWTHFASDWIAGRSDHEAGRDTPEAAFYAEAQAAHARHVATARAKAQASAGSRESADLLAYVRQLESEIEPLAEDAETPNAVVLFSDPDPCVRAAAAVVVDACDDLLRACVARDESMRVAHGVAAA